MRRLVLLGILAGALASGGAAPAAQPARTDAYVVRTAPGATEAAARAIREAGGTVTRRMAAVDALAARLTPAAAAALRRHTAVAALTGDVRVRLAGGDYEAKRDVNSLFNAEQIVGARSAWSPNGRSPGYTGAGVDVALVDSGVTPVAGLDTAGKLIHGPDLSFDSQNPALTRLDAYGHGTHMAGIIAGLDAGANPKTGIGNDTYFLGVAPDARLVSLKVADAYGATDVSQVIAAIDWVVQHRRSGGLNIRVLNLSFATPSRQSYLFDPLAHAAEVAWRKGIVVVAAAGNDGTGTGKLLTPAQNPHVLAVGAVDPRGTMSTDDDVVPDFSTRGDGVRNPDLVAPGTSLQSLRVPGSAIDVRHGDGPGSINARFFRGSGTSQAAAVTSGAVAILLEARPELTPDEVKAVLLRAARKLPAADDQAQGAGILDIRRALSATPKVLPPAAAGATGIGSLDGARGGYRLRLHGVVLAGERDIFGRPYDALERAGAREAEAAWSGGDWNGSTWAGSTWAGSTWAGSTWAGSTWAGSTWAGSTWADRVWNGSTWGGSTWGGSTWGGSTWGGSGWVGSTWAVGAWR